MKTVIATCCPYGNLEKIVTIFLQAGLDLKNDTFVQWHDMVFGSSETVDPLEIAQQSLQGVEINGGILEDSSEVREAPLLMADNRCLWLLETWAAKLPEAKFLLFYTHVDAALAYACRHGIEPQQAINSWQAASRQLLKFQRSNRRRTLLLDADAAIRQPQALLDVCSRIGILLQSLPMQLDPNPEQADLESYLAKLLLSNKPELLALEVELEASAQPLENESPLEIKPLDLFNQHSQWLVDHQKREQELKETVEKLQVAEYALNDQLELNIEQQIRLEHVQQGNQELEAAAKEVSLKNKNLLLQLSQAQEELEKTFLQKQELKQQMQKDKKVTQQAFQAQVDKLTKARDEQEKLNNEKEVKLETVQQEHQELRENIREISEENELFLLQLHQAQEELEKTFLQKQELKQQMQKDKEVTQQAFQAQVDKLTKAHHEQEKINNQQQANFEKVQQAYQGMEAITKEMTQENELLLLQLHQVQEELEKIFFQKQQIEQQTQLLENTKTEMNQELQQIKDELVNKERELEKQHQRMANMKETVSWKITAPIRSIGKPFKRLSKEKIKTQEQIKLLKTSGLFDEAWYTATYGDVVMDGYDPVEHYIRLGAAEGRDPSPVFNTQRYLECNPDVADAGMNPLVHYVKYGMTEQRYLG